MKSGQETPLIGQPDNSDLTAIVAALNKKDEVGKELRELADRWIKSGPNLQKMLHGDFELWRRLQEAWKVQWLPSRGARAYYMPTPKMGHCDDAPSRKACLLFAALVLNPKCEMVGGPCARRRCDKYFVKRRSSQKLYCSRRCGHIASADYSNRERLAIERRQKLERAQVLIRAWDRLRSRPDLDWREWIHRKDESISRKWLTRAIKPSPRGYGLRPPRKGNGDATRKK